MSETKTESKPSYKVETVSGSKALELVANNPKAFGGSVNDNRLSELPIGRELEGIIVGFGHRPYDGKLFLKCKVGEVPCRVGMTETFKPEFERLCGLEELQGESVKFIHYMGMVGKDNEKTIAHWAYTV